MEVDDNDIMEIGEKESYDDDNDDDAKRRQQEGEMMMTANDPQQAHFFLQPLPHQPPLPSNNLYLPYLPDDAMDLILSCLTLTDFARLSSVSKKLYQSVSLSSHLHMSSGSSPLLFSSQKRTAYSTGDIHSSTKFTTQQQQRANNTNDASSINQPPISPRDDLERLLGRYSNLNYLRLERLGPIGDDVVSILNESPAASTLTRVSLHGCALSYWCNQSFHLRHLQHITISGGSIRAKMYSLLKYSNNLKSLGITSCSKLRDDDVFDIGLLLHYGLQSLILNQCNGIQKPTMQFPNLQRLSLVGCFGLSSLEGFSCTNIVQLNLSFCIRLTGQQIETFMDRLPMLEELVMMKCSAATSLTLHSEKLRRLNLSFCHNLRELRLSCPSLVELQNFSCSSLRTFILDDSVRLQQLDLEALSRLERLEILHATSLSKLNLRGCKRLDHCQIDCPTLQQVYVRGSRTVALRFCKNVRQVLLKNWSNGNVQIQ